MFQLCQLLIEQDFRAPMTGRRGGKHTGGGRSRDHRQGPPRRHSSLISRETSSAFTLSFSALILVPRHTAMHVPGESLLCVIHELWLKLADSVGCARGFARFKACPRAVRLPSKRLRRLSSHHWRVTESVRRPRRKRPHQE